MKTYYLAFDIGCIECGEDSNVIGVFKTEKEAGDALIESSEIQSKDWHGEHHFKVFQIEVPG